MAFHVSCPITCRRICDCELGFPGALRREETREEFLVGIEELEEFLRDPWTVRIDGGGEEIVRIPVPRMAVEGEDSMMQIAWLQRKGAEDYSQNVEANLEQGEPAPLATEDQSSSAVDVICHICFSGQKEGSAKALKMLPCKLCNKKYHMSCLKSWAKNRDLFHWNSWTCPSCRICEVCQKAGDPNKLMFCRRCDGAYHCYCQQPPHKNVSQGPYLCPKHTSCHSCGSTVPGSGPSTRWFLGYTCCDACGRLFVKGNYCAVCLKVYRDSETTPMVCCDGCERWVHCECDGISDKKYHQFQADQNLQYQCAACRGECYQVKDIDDAIQELWRRKDEADHELMARLRASVALPAQEEMFFPSPNSAYDQYDPAVLKNDNVKSLKFSIKSSNESGKSASNNVSPNKLYGNKKAFHIKFVAKSEGSYKSSEEDKEERSADGSFKYKRPTDVISQKNVGQRSLLSSANRTSENGLKSSVFQLGKDKYTSTKEVGDNNVDQLSHAKIHDNKVQNLQMKECAAKTANRTETIKGTKLVIHLGSRNRNISTSPRSETSSCHQAQELATCYGSVDSSPPKDARHNRNHMHDTRGTVRTDGKGKKHDSGSQKRSSKHEDVENNVLMVRSRKSNGNLTEEFITTAPSGVRSVGCAPQMIGNEVSVPRKKRQFISPSVNSQNDNAHQTSRLQDVSGAATTDPKPLLKLKFKNPYSEHKSSWVHKGEEAYFEQRSSWVHNGEEEGVVKGQRSMRKRSSAKETSSRVTDEDNSCAAQVNHQESGFTDEVMDANWILQKLGMDAIGKRVEVYQSSEKSWYEGVVLNVSIQKGGTSSSSLSIHLDDGRSTKLELGKQAVRFVSKKQVKRSRI